MRLCEKKVVLGKSLVLSNAIDIEEAVERSNANDEDLPETEKYVTFLGRLSEQKDPIRFIEIAKNIHERIPDVKFQMVGGGHLKDKCEACIKECNLQNEIILRGFQTNPLPYLKSSYMMVMTSIHEGTPMAALEAFALGVPILSTPTDGMVDLIENGENGYLLEENNDFCDYAIRIIQEKQLYESLHEGALRTAKKLDMKKYVESLDEIYTKVMQ